MTTVATPEGSRPWHAPTIGALLVGGVLLRILVFGGVSDSDALAYAAAGRSVADGTFRPSVYSFDARYGLILPTGVAVWALGNTESALVLFPFACSIAMLLSVYALARRAGSRRAGLLALGLVATSPLDTTMATTLVPDGVVASTLALCFLSLPHPGVDRASIRRPLLRCLLAGIVLGFGILVKESAGFVAPAALAILLAPSPSTSRWMRVACFAAGAALALLPAVLYNLHVSGHPWPVLSPQFAGSSRVPVPWNPHQKAGFGTLLKVAFIDVPLWALNPLAGAVVFFGAIGFLGAFGTLWGLFRARATTWPFTAWWVSFYAVLFPGFWIFIWLWRGQGEVLEQQIRYLAPMLPPLIILGALALARWKWGTPIVVLACAFQVLCVWTLARNEAAPGRVFRDATKHLASLPPGPTYAEERAARLAPIKAPLEERGFEMRILPDDPLSLPSGAYVLIDELRNAWLVRTYGGRRAWNRATVPPGWKLLGQWTYPRPVSLRGLLMGRPSRPTVDEAVLLYQVP